MKNTQWEKYWSRNIKLQLRAGGSGVHRRVTTGNNNGLYVKSIRGKYTECFP